jgi:hypothetical protein
LENTGGGDVATVAGGFLNIVTGDTYTLTTTGYTATATADFSTIGGGGSNTVSDSLATIAGGGYNTVKAGGGGSVIAGGLNNIASGVLTFVAGGTFNTAAGDGRFAGGTCAYAHNTGSFVWGDNNGLNTAGTACSFNVSDSAADQFKVRATGGVTFLTAMNSLLGGGTAGVYLTSGGSTWYTVSDRNAKEHFVPVNGNNLLARLSAIPMSTWNYKEGGPRFRHMGPMAQDFYAAFGLGDGDKSISEIDGQGVALAGVQALYRLSLKKDAEIRALKGEVQQLRARDRKLTRQVQELQKVQQQIATLEARLAQLEARGAKGDQAVALAKVQY